MSLTFRLILLVFASLFGLMLALWASGDDGSWLRWLPAAFCFAISAMCIARGRFAHIFGGLIALGVIGGGLAYLVDMLRSGPVYTGRQSDGSLVNAVLFCVVFGGFAAKYLWATRFGFAKLPMSVGERVSVEFDDTEVRIRVVDDSQHGWNQQFRWADVTRVCFLDGGINDSDYLFISVRERSQRVGVPTEAHGGPELLSALSERGLFPEKVWRKALGETGGGMHCWPPHEETLHPRMAGSVQAP